MRLTGRGIAVLAAAIMLVAAGWWAAVPLLTALGVLFLAAVLAAVPLTAGGLRAEVRRSIYPDRVERGRPALARLRVRNPGPRRLGGFLATDAAGPHTRTVGVRALLPGAETVLHYELPTSRRGRFTVGPLTLHRADPFGLARSRRSTGETATLWVHPRQLPARVPAAGYPRHHHEGTTGDAALRGSVDVRDVREYVPGDEVRHLHWKATARTGRLMVRELTDPPQSRFTVLLDTTRPDRFEDIVEVAASLLGAAVQAGQHARLITSSGVDLAAHGGAFALRELLDVLCEIAPDATRAPPRLGSGPAGGGLVVVTAGDPGPVPAGRFRSVAVIALTADPVDVPGVRTLIAESAEDAVRRWNEAVG